MPKITAEVRAILWAKVGIIRNAGDLCEASRRLDAIQFLPSSEPSSQPHEAGNILEVARIITRSALAREESRGAHYRSDFPLKDETAAAKHSFAAKDAPVFFA